MKSTSVALILMVLANCGEAEREDPRPGSEWAYVNVSTSLRLRSAASIDAPVLATLPSGTRVRILERAKEKHRFDDFDGHWARVETPDSQIGWVFDAFLSDARPNQKDTRINGIWCLYLKPGEFENPRDEPRSGPWTHKITLEKNGTCIIDYNQGEGFENYRCTYTYSKNQLHLLDPESPSRRGVSLELETNTLQFKEQIGDFSWNINSELYGIRCSH